MKTQILITNQATKHYEITSSIIRNNETINMCSKHKNLDLNFDA